MKTISAVVAENVLSGKVGEVNEKSRNSNMHCCHYWNNGCVDMFDLRMDMVMEYSGMDESSFYFKVGSVKWDGRDRD